MGHVLLYTHTGAASSPSPSSPNKPNWNDATYLPPMRALAHQLTETDKV